MLHFDGASAALHIGANGNEGEVIVRNSSGTETIRLDGGSGDVILSNADCAEEFDLATDTPEPGTVMEALAPWGAGQVTFRYKVTLPEEPFLPMAGLIKPSGT